MDKLPPRIVRRVIVAPVAVALCLALLALSPLLVLLCALADVFLPGSWRTVRLAAFAVVYLTYEVLGLAWMFVLWVASGFGWRIRGPRFQEAHYGFMRWWLRGVNRSAVVLFKLRIQIEDRPTPKAGPILVFSRHAGPGNSLMLIGTLMIAYQRRPRIVMLAKLQWEPMFDIMLNRTPNRFIRHDTRNRDRYLQAIGELASGLGDRDAFVLFPEGHDFTQPLRVRAIDHLRRKGFHREAQKAEQMTNVLPPRHGGVMSAIESAPGADVVFVAHTVLEDVGSFGSLWRRIPFETPILSRYWRIAPDQIPRERQALIDWLFDWWARIDTWIDDRRDPRAGASRIAGKER